MFSKANFKLEVKTSQSRNLLPKSLKQKISLISYLTKFKIDANPGLALEQFLIRVS